VPQVRRNKASRTVPAPRLFGHRSIAGGESEWWCSTVIGAGMLLTEIR
jgi:hypothetical protein